MNKIQLQIIFKELRDFGFVAVSGNDADGFRSWFNSRKDEKNFYHRLSSSCNIIWINHRGAVTINSYRDWLAFKESISIKN